MVARFTCKEEREQRKRERTEKEREREKQGGRRRERRESLRPHRPIASTERWASRNLAERERERQQPLVRSEATYKH